MGSAVTFYGGQNQLQKKIHESGTLDDSETLTSVQSDGVYEETASITVIQIAANQRETGSLLTPHSICSFA